MAELKQLKESKWLTLWATANWRAARSRILLREYAELFHSREESCAVHSQARGSAIGAAHATPGRSECLYNLITPLSCVFVSNAQFVASRVCSVVTHLLHFKRRVQGVLLTCFSKFRQGSVK